MCGAISSMTMNVFLLGEEPEEAILSSGSCQPFSVPFLQNFSKRGNENQTYPSILAFCNGDQIKAVGASCKWQQHIWAEQKIHSRLDARGKGWAWMFCTAWKATFTQNCYFWLSEHFHPVWWELFSHLSLMLAKLIAWFLTGFLLANNF